MTVKLSSAWLDQLFIQDVGELERLGNLSPRTHYTLVRISGILRKLVLDEQPLVHHAVSRCLTPFIILVPEQILGSSRYEVSRVFPALVTKYAPEITEQTHPSGSRGYFLCPYLLPEYLKYVHMVLPSTNKAGNLEGRSITVREMILYFADKLGGVHADKNLDDIVDGGRAVDAETMHSINEKVSIFGEGALFNQFGIIGERIWRACAPLRDELLAKK